VTGSHRHPSVTSAAIAVVTVAAIFFALWVPIYASETPKVGALPGFYFYLLAYMPVVAWAARDLPRPRRPRATGW
jgi:hypothetical protein